MVVESVTASTLSPEIIQRKVTPFGVLIDWTESPVEEFSEFKSRLRINFDDTKYGLKRGTDEDSELD